MGTTIVSDEIRQRILTYFENQAQRHGLSAFTVDRMAKDLKISKRTIYQHFPTKDAIITTFMDSVKHRIDEHFGAMEKLDLPASMIMIKSLKGILDILTPFLNQGISDLKTLYPEIWQSLVAFRKGKFDQIFKLLRQAQTDGEINPNLNMNRLAYLLPQILDELFQPEVVFHPSHASRDMMEEVFLILFQGIFTGATRDSFPQLLKQQAE
ncbi:MAG TPA: hypothetical protein DHU63_04290 [Candidatus Marinimicrobia bacterium]|nr:hypothetical protein [Candidatus Neomarinimicrobiota bacterium]